MNKSEVEQLLEAELATMPEAARTVVRSRLTDPRAERRTWSYGPGEFECWRIGLDHTGDLSIVYQASSGAFRDHWGCLEAKSEDLGSDDRWYSSLYDAAIAASWLVAPAGHEFE